jgi:hypothetical protein
MVWCPHIVTCCDCRSHWWTPGCNKSWTWSKDHFSVKWMSLPLENADRKYSLERIQMATGKQTHTAWAPGIRDFDEMEETHLANVKCQGELKFRHPEPLACGRLLHIMIDWKIRWAATHLLALQASPVPPNDCVLAYQGPTHRPARPPPASPPDWCPTGPLVHHPDGGL